MKQTSTTLVVELGLDLDAGTLAARVNHQDLGVVKGVWVALIAGLRLRATTALQ
jgi:hypothetical protein